MTNARRIMLTLVAGLTVMAAVWAMPAKMAAQAAPQTPKNMSGKISSIQKAGQGTLQDSFTIDVTEDKVFFMVPQTKVTGDFKVGNQADVTYGFDKEGNKVASEIKVAGGATKAPAAKAPAKKEHRDLIRRVC